MRRHSFGSLNVTGEEIIPLNEYNRQFLLSLPDSITIELVGIRLPTLRLVTVVIENTSDGGLGISIKPTDAPHYLFRCYSSKNDFIDGVLPILFRLGLRIFHPADSHALSNWGFRLS